MSAPQRLHEYLQFKGWSQSDFAREIGHHQTSIGRLLAGKRGPGLELVHAIERVTADWPELGPIRTEEWLGEDDEQAKGAA